MKRGIFILILITILVFGCGTKNVFAQKSQDVSYVPLIGITSVPEPLALPKGPGDVIYHYAIKNFIKELPLADIEVVDNNCNPVKFVEGDDNNNTKLDYDETWRYICTTKLSTTTQSVATATGVANNITSAHKAYATVVVGSNNPPPLVSIVNITKVAYPMSLPTEGGRITFTYKVNNPGIVPLNNVIVTDDKCSAMSGKLGDTNYNGLLDTDEVWIYTCTANLSRTTTNTVTVTAFANGLKAINSYTLTVKVATQNDSSFSAFPNFGENPNPEINPHLKIIPWGILFGILVALVIFFFSTRKINRDKKQ